jgi:hypothetical protein
MSARLERHHLRLRIRSDTICLESGRAGTLRLLNGARGISAPACGGRDHGAERIARRKADRAGLCARRPVSIPGTGLHRLPSAARTRSARQPQAGSPLADVLAVPEGDARDEAIIRWCRGLWASYATNRDAIIAYLHDPPPA